MKLIELREIVIPDNLNHAPNVIPMPLVTYEGMMQFDSFAEFVEHLEGSEL